MSEEEAQRRYREALDSGLSDYEAREEGWPSDETLASQANLASNMESFSVLADRARNRRLWISDKRVIRILAVHGVNYKDSDPVAELWQEELWANGLQCEVEEVRWGSTGSGEGDTIAFVSPSYRRMVNARVENAMRVFNAKGPGIVLSHSMGTVLALHAQRKTGPRMPIICMASPLSNRFLSLSLQVVGYGGTPPSRPKHFWNPDDPVVGGSSARHPKYFDAVKVCVPDADLVRRNAQSEHDVRLYLSHPLVLDGIEEASRV